MEMPELPLLSSGTNHREFEYYDLKGNYIEKESVTITVKNYLIEVKIPKSIEMMKVVHVLYEYLTRHKEWCWNHHRVFQIIIGKIYELKKEKILTENDRMLLDSYLDILAPKPDFVDIPIDKEISLTIFSLQSQEDLSAFYRYFYAKYLVSQSSDSTKWILETNFAKIVLLWLNSEIIGYAYLFSRLEKNWLSSLHIKKEHRGKENGRKMIIFIRKQIGSFWLESSESAIGFYQKCGGQRDSENDNIFRFSSL